MPNVVNEVLAANKSYVNGFGNRLGELCCPRRVSFAILTRMDAGRSGEIRRARRGRADASARWRPRDG